MKPELPIMVTVVADWTKNLIQISQLQLCAESGKAGLQSGRVQIASTSTIVKLVFFSLRHCCLWAASCGWLLVPLPRHRDMCGYPEEFRTEVVKQINA